MIGVLKSTQNRLENGEIDFEYYRDKLAKALGCKPADLDIPHLKLKTSPVTLYVKNQNYVSRMPKDKVVGVQEIPGLPKTTEVLIIKNPALKKIHGRNELLYFDSVPTTKEAMFLNRECIVKIEKKTRGDTLLAWVTKGSGKGKYILHAHDEPLAVDVSIISANPILHVRKA